MVTIYTTSNIWTPCILPTQCRTTLTINRHHFDISSCCHGKVQAFALQGCYTVQTGSWLAISNLHCEGLSRHFPARSEVNLCTSSLSNSWLLALLLALTLLSQPPTRPVCPGARLPGPARRALPITHTLLATSVTEQFQNVLTFVVFPQP